MRRITAAMMLVTVVLSAGCLSMFGGEKDSGEQSSIPDGFVKADLPYNDIEKFQVFNDTVTYIGVNASGEYLMHGETVVAPAEDIYQYRYNDGRWAYIEKIDSEDGGEMGDDYILHYDGYTSPKYDLIDQLVGVGNSWAYVVHNDSANTFKAFYKGQPIGLKYDEVVGVAEVDDNLAYWGRVNNNTVVVHDGNEVKRGDDLVGGVADVAGKFTYVMYDGPVESRTATIVRGGRWHPTSYTNVRNMHRINNSLAYAGVNITDGTLAGFYVVHGEERYGPFDTVTELREHDGRLLFVAEKDYKKRLWYDGKWVTGYYRTLKEHTLTPVGSMFAYKASNTSQASQIFYGDRTLDVNGRTTLAEQNGGLVIAVDRPDDSYLLKEQG